MNGLREGEHFLRIDHDKAPPIADVVSINRLHANAMTWYRPHSIGRTATLLWAMLGGVHVGDHVE